MPTIGDAGQPAYVEIADSLREAINNRTLKAGDQLPAERVLVEHFGVARMTVRHALDILQLEGLIDRKRGRSGGTFVRQQPPAVELLTLSHSVEKLIAAGHEVTVEPLTFSIERANRGIAERLEVPDPRNPPQIYQVQQRFLLNGIPAAVMRAYCPVDFFEELGTKDRGDFIAPYLEPRTSRTTAMITLSAANGEDRKLLEVLSNVPLICVDRIGFGLDDKPTYCLTTVLRSDVMTVHVSNEKIKA
ncbi:GntR family transcriptional regulator [Corynebacterium poyangense]|uniref:GntR family transcriptional regulator n=1 Tax=Corynebacterium poyangense TaxID=2684405 RepID=UPI001CCA03A7|nr:GntR family transcriptional regulator [Corynebacterium poyangense]